MAAEGNVVASFGADNTGSSDASSAIQSAMNSGRHVIFPGGTYLIDAAGGVDIPGPRVITCMGGSMATGFSDGTETFYAAQTYEQVRFVTSAGKPADWNMFNLLAEQIFWRGGCVDLQNLTGHTGAAFYLDVGPWGAESNGGLTTARGWGGAVRDTTVLGNVNDLRAGTGGSKGIHIHFPLLSEYPVGENRAYQNSFITMWFFSMQGLGLGTCIYHDPLIEASHWSNTHMYKVNADYCQQAVYDDGGKGTSMQVWHKSANVFPDAATADTTPSVYLGGPAPGTTLEKNMLWHPQWNDFRDDTLGGYYYNRKTLESLGENFYYGITQGDYDRSISIAQGEPIRMFNSIQFREGAQLIP